jgi:hypothetical protein
MFGLHWELMDKTSRRLWLMENREVMYGCFDGDGDGDGGGGGDSSSEADGPPGSGLGPSDTATTDGGNMGPSGDSGGDDGGFGGFGPSPGRSQAEFGSPVAPSEDPTDGFGLGPPGAGYVGRDSLADVDVSLDTVQSIADEDDSLADQFADFVFSRPVGLTHSQHMSFISNLTALDESSPTGFSPFGTPTNVMAMDMARPDAEVFGFGVEVPMAEEVPGMLAGLVTGALTPGPFSPAVSAVASSFVDARMGLPVDAASVVGKAVSSVVGSQVTGAVAPAVAQGIYGATESIPGAIAGGVVAGGLAGRAAGSLAGGFASSLAGDAMSGQVTGSSISSAGSSGSTTQAQQSGISVTGVGEDNENESDNSSAFLGGTTPDVNVDPVDDTTERTTTYGITGLSDSARFGQTSGRGFFGGRQFAGRQFGTYSPTVQFSAQGGRVARQSMQSQQPSLKNILDEVGRDVYTLSKFGYTPEDSEIKKSASAMMNPREKNPLKEYLSFLTDKERKDYSKGYIPVGDLILNEIQQAVGSRARRKNYAEGGTVQSPAVIGRPETRDTLSTENVADDVPMNGEDGGFVINAPAVAQAGKMYIQELINEATDSLRAKGNRVVTKAGKEVDEDVVPLMVSDGEVYLPPEIAKEIGISRLEKINNRGKKKVAELQKRAEAKAPQKGFVAAPA